MAHASNASTVHLTSDAPSKVDEAVDISEHFRRLEREFRKAMTNARLQVRNFKKRLSACVTRQDLMLSFSPQLLARLRGKNRSPGDLMNDRDRTLARFIEITVADCGRDLMPEAARTVLRAVGAKRLDPKTFAKPIRLPRKLRNATKGLPCDDETLRQFWTNSVMTMPKGSFPKRLSGPTADRWDACRDQIKACALLAELTNAGASHSHPLADRIITTRKTKDPVSAEVRETSAAPQGPSQVHNNTPGTAKSWEQAGVDQAIREFRNSHSEEYAQLLDRIKKDDPGAIRDAQRIFGQRAIAKALQVPSKTMVGKSPTWKAIASELQLPRGRNVRPPPKQASFNKLLEQKSMTANTSPLDKVVQNETIEMLRAQLGPKEAQATIDKLESRQMTDEQVREMLKIIPTKSRPAKPQQS